MVEIAFALPIFLVLIVGMLELGRYVYVRSVLESDARAAARAAAIDLERTSDCPAWAAGTDSGGGVVSISVDPASRISEFQKRNPTAVPPANHGYLYIYPAAAHGPVVSNSSNCSGCPSSSCWACDKDGDGGGPYGAHSDQFDDQNQGGSDCSQPPLGSKGNCLDTSDPNAVPECPAITVFERYKFVPLAPVPAMLSSFLIQVCVTDRIQTETTKSAACP